MRNFLRAQLVGHGPPSAERRRLDLHALIQKGSHLRFSTMRVLVEPINVPEAEQWVDTAMRVAYAGELLTVKGNC